MNRWPAARIHMLTTLTVMALSVTSSEPSETPLFRLRFPSPASGIDPQILNAARVENPQIDWPATLFFKYDGEPCTATIVGQHVLLTAAHCVPDGSEGIAETQVGDIMVECNRMPGYSGDTDSKRDIALCYSDSIFKSNTPAETLLNVGGSEGLIGKEVSLLGYGCIDVQNDRPDYAGLYLGTARIKSTDTAETGTHFVTKGGSAFCWGDSGGAAYSGSGIGRRIIGVNSQGDIRSHSIISAVTSNSFIAWAGEWSGRDGSRSICGLGTDAKECR